MTTHYNVAGQQATLSDWPTDFFSLYYDTLKHETVIKPTILFTFIDLMYALLLAFTHDQRDKGRRIK